MGIPRSDGSDGYTLIEVLVALCIFSIAALGVAELQWQAFAGIHRAALHGEALALASDIAERLRGVPDAQALFLDSDSPLPDTDTDTDDCDARACTAAQLAAADLRVWLESLRSRLPAARLLICADAAPWDEARASLRWDCAGVGPVWVKLGWRENASEDDAPRLALLLPGGGQ